MPCGCLKFQTLKEGEREATFHLRGGRGTEFTPRKKVGNFHVSQQLWPMIVAVRGHHSGDSRPDIPLRAIAHVQHTPPSKINMDWLDYRDRKSVV